MHIRSIFAALALAAAVLPTRSAAQSIGEVWSVGQFDGWMNYLVIGSISTPEGSSAKRFNLIRLPLTPATEDGVPAFGYVSQELDCAPGTIATLADVVARRNTAGRDVAAPTPAAPVSPGGRDARINAVLCGGEIPADERISEEAFLLLSAPPAS